MDQEGLLSQIDAKLDAMMKGKPAPALGEESVEDPHLRAVLNKIDALGEMIVDGYRFGVELARGNLDAPPPSRKNVLSSPLKELHSQLTSLTWSISQLMEGNIVSKLYYPGPMITEYNKMIEKVARMLSGEGGADEWGSSVTSWRYHQLLSALNHLHIIVLEVDEHGAVLFANPPAKDLLDGKPALPYGAPEAQNSDLLRYLSSFADTMPAKQEYPLLRELYDETSGAWYKITSDRVELADGSFGLLHMADDISEWKRHEQRLRRRASIDPLTGVYTRSASLSRLEEVIRGRATQTNTVAFVDIDGLKLINDMHGHTEGDYVIKSVAEVLQGCVRDTDWVIRYGGDEFLVIFADCTSEAASIIIARMYEQLEEKNNRLDKPYRLSFSIGVTQVHPEISSIADLISEADSDMYRNKAVRKGSAGA